MKTYFNINELIQKGKSVVKEYELPAGTVYVRPLTDLELNEADALAFDAIDDQTTKTYMMNVSEDKESGELPEGVIMGEILKASTEVNASIVCKAMEDFTDAGLTVDMVKQLSGITALADFVREISGASPDSKELVEDFRE
jgi:hypothetical protein